MNFAISFVLYLVAAMVTDWLAPGVSLSHRIWIGVVWIVAYGLRDQLSDFLAAAAKGPSKQ